TVLVTGIFDAPGPVVTTPVRPSMTTPTLLTAGQAAGPAGGHMAAGGTGSATGDVKVKAPAASGPETADGGTLVAQPAPTRAFNVMGRPQSSAVAPLPQLV